MEKDTRTIIEQLLNGDYSGAEKTLSSVLNTLQQKRETRVADIINEDESDDKVDDNPPPTDDSSNEPDVQDVTDNDDQPPTDDDSSSDDNPPPTDDSSNEPDVQDVTDKDNLDNDDQPPTSDITDFDKLNDSVKEIQVNINKKIINKAFDIIAKLKNILNSSDLSNKVKQFDEGDDNTEIDVDTLLQYQKLDEPLNYYSEKLSDIQKLINPSEDQEVLLEKIQLIFNEVNNLSADIKAVGSSTESTDVPLDNTDDDNPPPEDTDQNQQN